MLLEKKMPSLPPDAVQSLVDSGDWVVVDVRPREEYEKSSILGAVNAPLFQLMDWSKPTPASFLRGAAYALNGVQAVEPNASFAEDIKSRCGGKNVIMVSCLPLAPHTSCLNACNGTTAQTAAIPTLGPVLCTLGAALLVLYVSTERQHSQATLPPATQALPVQPSPGRTTARLTLPAMPAFRTGRDVCALSRS